MLYWLTIFSDGGDFWNLFRYITFRAGGAFFTALVFGFFFGRPLINLLRSKQKQGQLPLTNCKGLRNDQRPSQMAHLSSPFSKNCLLTKVPCNLQELDSAPQG